MVSVPGEAILPRLARQYALQALLRAKVVPGDFRLPELFKNYFWILPKLLAHRWFSADCKQLWQGCDDILSPVKISEI